MRLAINWPSESLLTNQFEWMEVESKDENGAPIMVLVQRHDDIGASINSAVLVFKTIWTISIR